MNNFSILINTTDSFEDCWIPFFTLFKKYWPDYTGKIYLNTETKVFTYPGLNIISIQNNQATPDSKITWSECLLRALKSIDNEVILYMQEDYFLKDDVKNDLVEKYVSMMQENLSMHCIHLTDSAVIPDKKSDQFEGLYSVVLKQRYRISCQAALWRKDTLKTYLRTYESAWEFEEFGSKRATIANDNFYVVDNQWVKLNKFEIIPYIFTGIIQGRWFEETVPLFQKHNIHIDYTKRGFVKDAKPKPLSKKVKYQWKRLPTLLKYNIELLRNNSH
ncbi:MAG: hypothetical protein WCP96_10785 [Methylococcaceae bacterium]